jgi:hypothetical protein
LSSIAIDQFIEIKTARPKLQAALAAADTPVDLGVFLSQANGEDIPLNYWGKAIDTTSETNDTELLQMAHAAYLKAQAKNFLP